jgi:hypothetical protein
MYRRFRLLSILLALLLSGNASFARLAMAMPPDSGQPSRFRSADDGWFDVSGFLDKPKPEAGAGFGRPSITMAGGIKSTICDRDTIPLRFRSTASATRLKTM